MDTQWPRWEVFEKERPDSPYRNAGSVHAPDPEMALENARDVFVRRPRCAGLWVVPASALYTKTVQELAAQPDPLTPVATDSEPQPYLIFVKQTQRATETFVTHLGQVEAHSAPEALTLARNKFGDKDVFVWWVCPVQEVVSSEESDVEPMFTPADSKPYRHPQFYKVVSQLREIKSKS
jgi:ring-1,2-phenylacetyl-CoA epoxidase subunit PaaB